MNSVESFEDWHTGSFHSKDGKDWEQELKLMNDAYNYTLLTIWHNGVILAVVGCQTLRRKVVEVFSIPSIYAQKHLLAYVKHMKHIVNNAYRLLDVHRLQMTISDANPQGIKWAKALGFSYEGLLVKYDEHGGNHLLFSKVV